MYDRYCADMRTRGWQGDPPADDDDARARILDAAGRCLDRYRERMTLSDVAAEVGVTRQTVYRYYRTTADLLRAVSIAHASDYLDGLVAHLSRYDDPIDIFVRSIIYSVEHLPTSGHLIALAAGGHQTTFIEEITSPISIDTAVAVLQRLNVDWEALGIPGKQLRELAELSMRLIQTFLIRPWPSRDDAELHRFLLRWIGPALIRAEPMPQLT